MKNKNPNESIGVRLGKLTLRDIASQLRMAPNLLSMSRIVFLPLVVFLIKYDYKPWSIIALVSLWVTDFVDGYIARRFRQKSDLGLLLDPVADKITSAAIFITLLSRGLPLWVVLIVIGRDIIILSAGFYIFKRDLMISSDQIGRITTVLISIIIMMYVIGLQQYAIILCYLLIPFAVITLFRYGLKFYKLTR